MVLIQLYYMNMDFVISDIQFNNLCQKELELQKQKMSNLKKTYI